MNVEIGDDAAELKEFCRRFATGVAIVANHPQVPIISCRLIQQRDGQWRSDAGFVSQVVTGKARVFGMATNVSQARRQRAQRQYL
jgi:hypothetical protein